MTSDPDQIREQIEETRTSLSQDVNTLANTVNPAHAAKAHGRQRTFCRSEREGQGYGDGLAVRLRHEFCRGREGVGGPGTAPPPGLG